MNPTPLEDALSTSMADAAGMPLYPLVLAMCDSCSHVFLPYVVPPDESYSNYFFSSAKSPGLSDVMTAMARALWLDSGATAGSTVVDVGSNDGTFLQAFRALGADVLGVEPAERQAKLANEAGVPTQNRYFNEESAADILAEQLRPSVITVHNVLANIPDPVRFMRNVASIAASGSLISVVSGYHPDQFSANMVDYVYHEHLSYFTAHDFRFIADAVGMEVVSARRISLKGGSIHVVLRLSSGEAQHSSDFMQLLAWERWVDLGSDSYFRNVEERIAKNFSWIKDALADRLGDVMYGYGCSHSVTTLIYGAAIGSSLNALVDDNEGRHGFFAPGSALEILSPEVLRDSLASVIILAWQHDWRIRARLRELNHRGAVLQFMPHPSITVARQI